METIIIHTDGSAHNKVGARDGGLGVVIRFTDKAGIVHKKNFYEGQYVNTTSARMEIMAVIRALELIAPTKKYKILIHSDNQYVVNTVEERWLDNWLSRGQEKANMDLWRRFKTIYDLHGGSVHIKLQWIKGHAGHEFNEIADRLADKGRHQKTRIQDRPNEL
jgi:ribonuclease HI